MDDSLLLVLPVHFLERDGRLCFEKQACNGLERWAEHFDRLVVACPNMPPAVAEQHFPWMAWRDVGELGCADRLELHPLPYAWRLRVFLRELPRVRPLLREAIRKSRYLHFGVHDLIGDWASVGCVEAIRLGRAYAVWTDNVATRLARDEASGWKRRLRVALSNPPMALYHRHLIRRSSLGLFNGRDCFEAYAPLCVEPHCVHDVHTRLSDQIDASALEAKVQSVQRGDPLRLCYVGRTTSIKGPLDWVGVVDRLRQAGVDVRATWLGDGPQQAEMAARVAERGLADRIELAGFVADHARVLEVLRAHHLLLFCHKTQESPRALVEALVSGCPLVGYESAYARDLVGEGGPASFAAQDDEAGLAAALLELHADRTRLAAWMRAAAELGRRYSDVAVFRERSELIKRFLPVPDRAGPA